MSGKLRCLTGQARGQAPYGGRSTGPRTAEGMARIRAASTLRGGYSADVRAFNRHRLTFLRRSHVRQDAVRHDLLPPDSALA